MEDNCGKIINFLKEYEKICQIYGLQIVACGCCNSPYLNDAFCGFEINNIRFNKKEEKIYFDIEYIGRVSFEQQTIEDLKKRQKDLKKIVELYKEKEENNEQYSKKNKKERNKINIQTII